MKLTEVPPEYYAAQCPACFDYLAIPAEWTPELIAEIIETHRSICAPRPQHRHLVRFHFDRAEILRHPELEEYCDLQARIDTGWMRLENGRMQVQGLYEELDSGNFERRS